MPAPPPPRYAAFPVVSGRELVDVRLTDAGRVRHLAGRGGPEAERARALERLEEGGLPVFIGAGLGAGIAAVRERFAGPIFVLDRETAIDAATGVRAAFAEDADVHFLDDPDPDRAAAVAADAARTAGFAKLALIVHPVYPRLDPDWYGPAMTRLDRYARLREKLTIPRFTAAQPRVLLLWRPYFLYREIEAALDRLSIPCHRLDTGDGTRGETGVIEGLLAAIADFHPDFALTVNHLGLDREGRLAGLLADIGLPLASWFVDSPRLILHDYAGLATAQTVIFSYDADALPELAAMGFAQRHWLPLATDPERFRPGPPLPPDHPWRSPVAFVGESMERQAADALGRLPHTPIWRRHLPELARAFSASPERSAKRFLETDATLAAAYAALPSGPSRLDAELALTWEATRRYRQDCVRALLPQRPCIVGDAGWETALPGQGSAWRLLPGLDYYEDLPRFYQACAINFNCTSLQMKGAVNQRVFDVPACGGFLVTDARAQMDRLFEPERETMAYADPAAIPDRIAQALAQPELRTRVSQAARKRILAEHTYVHRLRTLAAIMRQTFGG